MEFIKYILNRLYYVTLMSYFERDKYFNKLVDETEIECKSIALKIILKQKLKA